MKKVFVDTNILIDLVLRRDPFYEEAAILFSMADLKLITLSVSSLTIANAGYILLKQLGPSKSKALLRKIRLIVEILPLNDKIIDLALNDDSFSDLEDGFQYFTAVENRQDYILTRNLQDFKNSKLPTMTAKQFTKSFNQGF